MKNTHDVNTKAVNELAQMIDGMIEVKEQEQAKDNALCNEIEKRMGKRIEELESRQEQG